MERIRRNECEIIGSILYKIHFISLSIAFIACAVVSAADLKASNIYYAEDGVIRESLALKNIDFENKIEITKGLISNFYGRSDSDKSSYIKHVINEIDSGASLEADAKEMEYGGFFASGSNSGALISYAFDSGKAKTGYFNQITSAREEIISNDCRYQSAFGATPEGLYSQASGIPMDDDSSFEHDIWLRYLNKGCQIKSYLITGQDKSDADYPVNYFWSSYAVSNSIHAEMGMSMNVREGNRDAEFQLKGTSSELSDKFAPINGEPCHLDKIWKTSPFYALGYTKTLTMDYEIDI